MRWLWHSAYSVPRQGICIFCKSVYLVPRQSLARYGARWNTTAALACSPPLSTNDNTSPTTPARTSIVDYIPDIAKTTESIRPSSSPYLLNSTPSMLAEFHRAMATRDMDRIWALYNYLYQNDALQYLTRRNYRQLFLCTIRARTTRKNLHRLLVIVDDMRARHMKLRFSEYDSLIRWVGGATVPSRRSHHLTEAIALFDEMLSSNPHDKHGHPRLLAIYNALIHVAAQLLDMPTAQRLYHDMMAREIYPNAYTYSSLLFSMGRMGDIEGMEHMWDQLRSHDLHNLANSVTWNVVMASYAMHGINDRATQLFYQMYDALLGHDDHAPPADTESFRIYFSVLLREHRRDEALEMLSRMARYDLPPTIAIYNTFFASFMTPVTDDAPTLQDVPTRDAPEELALLHRLYASMQQAKVTPNSDTMYTLVSALLDLGDTTFALKTFVQLGKETDMPISADMQCCSVSELIQRRRTLLPWKPLRVEARQPLMDRLNHIVSLSRTMTFNDNTCK